MSRPPTRHLWLLFRLVIYMAVVIALFMTRGLADRSRRTPGLPVFPRADSTLSVAGLDLAPGPLGQLLDDYRRDYPELSIHRQGGGTARALEALINGRADVAFLSRPPTPAEQSLVRSARRDTVLWFPVALGGIVLVHAAGSGVDSLALDDLRRLVSGRPAGGWRRLYAPDPNLGLYDAFLGRLGVAASPARPVSVIFLADEAAVLDAVRAEKGSLGLVSSLTLPDDLERRGLGALAVSKVTGGPAARPGYQEIGTGRYPLYHYLYVACGGQGSITGAMFVTHLTSDRGQRQVERAGCLPARQVLREIILTRGAPAGAR